MLLHQLLTGLGAPGLMWDDVDPVAICDNKGRVFMAEVRLGLEDGERLECNVALASLGRTRKVFGILAKPDEGQWSVTHVTIGKRRVDMPSDIAFRMACSMVRDIRDGRVPELDGVRR